MRCHQTLDFTFTLKIYHTAILLDNAIVAAIEHNVRAFQVSSIDMTIGHGKYIYFLWFLEILSFFIQISQVFQITVENRTKIPTFF